MHTQVYEKRLEHSHYELGGVQRIREEERISLLLKKEYIYIYTSSCVWILPSSAVVTAKKKKNPKRSVRATQGDTLIYSNITQQHNNKKKKRRQARQAYKKKKK